MTRPLLKSLARVLCAAGVVCGCVGNAFAAGFQLWEQNVTNIENFHAGRAALANDASTAYDNPAGITRIKNQQVVMGAMGIFSDLKFKGDTSTCVFGECSFTADGVAQGGNFTLVPDLHYAAPINSYLGFGLSVVSPYGSDVEFGQNTFISDIVTRSRIQVVDIAPALGVQITKKLSAGFGIDIEKMSAELDSILLNLPSITKGYDTAYGYHMGALYEFSASTRAGIAYHSKVAHHLKGTSNYIGSICAGLGYPCWDRAMTTVYLPPDTTFSIYHRLNSKWAIMGTAVYTQWNIVHNLVVQHIAGVDYPVDYTMNFINTWTYSVGADYDATDKLILRVGGGFDKSPTRNGFRTLQLPDSSRYDIAMGAHYQFMKTLGFDVGWNRVFLTKAAINPPLKPISQYPLDKSPNGTTEASADVIGAQLTWDIV